MQEPHTPICPKCGYDQSGEIATWETQCPLEGRCSECGIAFAWSERFRIMNEWGSEVDWYAEHALSIWQMVKRTPGTLARIFLPSMLFRVVNFRRKVNVLRLFCWMLLLLATLWILSSIPAGYACSSEYAWAIWSWEVPIDEYDWFLTVRDLLNAITFPYLRWYYRDGLAVELGSDAMGNAFLMSYGIIPFIAISVFWTVIVVAIPKSRPHALHNPRLLIRGILLGMLPVIMLIFGVRVLTSVYVYRGWRYEDEWVLYSQLVLWFICLFWQQCIWTAFVRWGMGVMPSWYINLPGFFVSLILGFIVMIKFII